MVAGAGGTTFLSSDAGARIKYEEVYLCAYADGREAKDGIGADMRLYNGSRPRLPWREDQFSSQVKLFTHRLHEPAVSGLQVWVDAASKKGPFLSPSLNVHAGL